MYVSAPPSPARLGCGRQQASKHLHDGCGYCRYLSSTRSVLLAGLDAGLAPSSPRAETCTADEAAHAFVSATSHVPCWCWSAYVGKRKNGKRNSVVPSDGNNNEATDGKTGSVKGGPGGGASTDQALELCAFACTPILVMYRMFFSYATVATDILVLLEWHARHTKYYSNWHAPRLRPFHFFPAPACPFVPVTCCSFVSVAVRPLASRSPSIRCPPLSVCGGGGTVRRRFRGS